MLGLRGLTLSGNNGMGGGSAPSVDALAVALAALEAAGKLVCAWFLPTATPAQYLTLSGADVTAWTAAYGTQKVNLASETAAPQWDATLFSNKGGVTFNGTTQRLLGTGNVTNWPDNASDLWQIVACTAGTGVAFAYGSSVSSLRRVNPTSITGGYGVTAFNGSANLVGVTAVGLGTGHTFGVQWDMGGTCAAFLDGISDVTAASGSPASLTRTRVRLGATVAASASQFYVGTISCVAILDSTASLSDFTALSALMQARVT